MRIIASLRSLLGQLARCISRLIIDIILCGFPSSRKARTRIKIERAKARESFQDGIAQLSQIADKLRIEDVYRYTANEAERRRSIDEKAKSNLMAITLSITLLIGGLISGGRREPNVSTSGAWEVLTLFLLVLGVVYLMFSGLMAIDALRIMETDSPSPKDEAKSSPLQWKALLLWSLEQNQQMSLIRTNSISVSHQSMVNGIVCLAMYLMVSAVRLFLAARYT